MMLKPDAGVGEDGLHSVRREELAVCALQLE